MRLPRKYKYLFSVIVLGLFLLYSVVTGKNPQELFTLKSTPSVEQQVQGIQTDKQEATVVKVVDGDTLTVSIDGKKEKIRVIGINTPETVDPRRAVQCFGKEASNFSKQTLSGQTVLLESDPSQTDRDKYGRLLRFVWIDNGKIDFGKLLLSEGYAQEYTYDVPYKYQTAYREAERQAQEKKKGLWADEACAKEFK